MANYVSLNSVVEGDRSLNHGCYAAYSAEHRFFGFKNNIFSIRSLAYYETFAHSSSGYTNFPFDTDIRISSSVSPLKGGYPHNIMYIITPQLQTSHFSSYDPFITSGAV